MSSRIHAPFVTALLLGLGFAASACTAILVPDVDDDGVDRCNTTEDCPAPGDTRHQSACVFGEDQAENSDKVCTVVFNSDVNCLAGNFDPATTEYGEKWEDAQTSPAYMPCGVDDLGKEGCRPDAGNCDGDLEVSEEYGTCVNPDDLLKAIDPGGDDFEPGFDIADQICRYHFCDERFVCNMNTGNCEICTDGETMKNGGCVELWLAGEPSSVYLDADHSECGDVKSGESMIGDVP